ncbi:PfkB family carbohydrate kinase [Streptomyces sp. NBC_01317]|uniref:PfkB family carbohydrate kinase n=1 Tax=Streptomyces sp. NBC_01317 TaxID=2903822 RepID=UPI002E0F0308|nr:PfkB family carbohydrate kinase [Streptomyces sp. NBC_01317]
MNELTETPKVVTPQVVIVGNLTIDDVVLPDGRTSMASPGGNAVYSAAGARLWQVPVGVVTRRGEDFPAEHLARLDALGIDTAGVVPIPGPTVRSWVLYGEDGSREWVYRTPAERSREVAVRPGDLPVRWLTADPAPVVHIAAMPLPASAALVDAVRAQAPGAVITLDTHEGWAHEPRADVLALAARVDVFVPSREELADLAGYDDPERAVADLRTHGVRDVVVKLGAAGALACRLGEDPVLVPAHPVEAVDPTGAGDAFCGGLAAGLGGGESLLAAVRRGCASASFAVTSFGSMTLADTDPAEAARRLDPAGSDRRLDHGGDTPAEDGDASAENGATAAQDPEPYEISVMMDEIDTVPEVIEDHLRDADGAVQAIADLLVEHGIEHLYLTGCGDSAFAGSATALAFAKHAGVAAEGVHALDLARYRVRYLPPRSAVLGVSFSGKVGRTTEALVQAERFGHLTIALTNNPEGALARAAQHLLPIDVPTLGFSPGTSTYLGMVTTLLDLALRWGTARGRDTSAARAVLETGPELARSTLKANAEPARQVALMLRDQPWVTFLGAGPNEAGARFGAAKLFEGPQIMGVSTNTEEWAHEEYFVTTPGTPVVLVAPDGAGYDRAEEIIAEIDFIGGRPILVSDREPAHPAHLLPLAPGLPEEFTPLLAALPLSLIGFHLADTLGKRSYNFGSEEVKAEHYDTIHRATIGEPA